MTALGSKVVSSQQRHMA
jgi:T-complex protein 1 subunit epsilon